AGCRFNSPAEATRVAAGTPMNNPTLSCGHARTQSKQNVQSKLSCFRGRYSFNSQPDRFSRPRTQSCVRQVAHALGLRTCTPPGETSDCTKLNWPTGQTYLQNVPPRNSVSMVKAAPK